MWTAEAGLVFAAYSVLPDCLFRLTGWDLGQRIRMRARKSPTRDIQAGRRSPGRGGGEPERALLDDVAHRLKLEHHGERGAWVVGVDHKK